MPSNEHILIVDDDTRNIFALSAVLKSRGYSCLSANNVSDALTFLEERKDIGVILLDMMMPEMDGYEAIPLVKEIDDLKKIPIIAVTAQAMMGDKERCLEAGADGYISKPVNVDELVAMLKRYLP